MTNNVPELVNQEKNTLYIIGNGFDCFHQLPSRYKDFYKWLKDEVGEQLFIDEMQNIFDSLDQQEDMLWCNFEEALGDYNLSKIYQYYLKSPDDSLGINKWDIANEKVARQVSKVCEKIRPLIKKWAITIPVSRVRPCMRLSKDSYYFTFNYTKILKNVYNIESEHICHIHGNIDDIGELITGHNAPKSDENIQADSVEEEKAKKKIISAINGLAKNPNSQIDKENIFFLSLPKILHVVVFGHSMAEIDWRYFGKILETCPDASWHFLVHSEEDKRRVKAFVKQANIREKKLSTHNIYFVVINPLVNKTLKNKEI